MGRNATLHIQNETGYDMTLVDSHIDHGKFQDHWSPPNSIAKGTTEHLRSATVPVPKSAPRGT